MTGQIDFLLPILSQVGLQRGIYFLTTFPDAKEISLISIRKMLLGPNLCHKVLHNIPF